jgi:TolB-like protein
MTTFTKKTCIRIPVFALLAASLVVAALLAPGCAPKPQYHLSELAPADTVSLAALPLVNLTRYEEAGDVIMNSLLVELLAIDMFEIIDPGMIDDVILQMRIRLTDRLPLATMQEIGRKLDADYLLLGSVNEYEMITDRTETVPLVSISLRIVRSDTGTIFWAATHTKRGDDAESVFGMGRITTLEQLAAATVKEIAGTLKE